MIDTDPTPAPASTSGSVPAPEGRLDIGLENRLSEIVRLAEILEDFGEAHGVSGRVVFKLNLTLDEILTNIIEYGYEDGRTHEIRVVLVLIDGRIEIEVIDDGRPYDPTSQPEPDLSLSVEERPIGGLGIYFARRMMDRVDYRREGGLNRLRLVRRIGEDQEPGSDSNQNGDV